MKYTISLSSRKDTSLAAQVRNIELGNKGEKPTEVLGNAIRALLKWTKAYPKPFVTITREDGQVVEAFLVKGNDLPAFTEANMASILAICLDVLPMETILTVGHTKDPLVLDFMHTLGLLPKDVKSVAVSKMEQDIKAKWASFKAIFRVAKADAKEKVFLGQTPKAVLDAIEAQKQKAKALKSSTATA